MARKKIDKIRKYDEYQPERTPKTGKITKASKRQLDEIKAQALSEEAFANLNANDVVEGVSFAGMVFLFKYGINPSIFAFLGAMGKVAQEVLDTMIKGPLAPAYVVVKVFNWYTQEEEDKKIMITLPLSLAEKEALVKAKIAEMRLEKQSQKTTLEGNAKTYAETIKRDEERIHNYGVEIYGGTFSNGAKIPQELSLNHLIAKADSRGDTVLAGQLRRNVNQKLLQIDNLTAINQGGFYIDSWHWEGETIMPDATRTIEIGRVQARELLIEQIRLTQEEIDRQILNEKDYIKLQRKMESLSWVFAIGQAAGWRWFLKSYEPAEAIENSQFTG